MKGKGSLFHRVMTMGCDVKMEVEKLQKQLKTLLVEVEALTEKAEKENRNFNDGEQDSFDEKMTEIDRLKRRIKKVGYQPFGEPIKEQIGTPDELRIRFAGRVPDGYADFESASRVMKDRSYRSMFPDAGIESGGFASFDEFAGLVQLAGRTGVSDDRLTRSFQEGIPSDGGFAVPTEWAQEIFNISLEQEVVRPRARLYPMGSDSKKVPAIEIGSHDSHLYGGLIGYWGSESGTLTASAPKFRSVELIAKKLYVYGYSSSEWSEDAILANETIASTFSGGLGWYLDRAFLKGDGAGKPLGVLNAPCLISQAAENGQTAATICFDNLAKMLSRLHSGCFRNSVWIAHPTTIPQLLTLSIAIGTGGAHEPVLKDAGSGSFSILTRPCFFSEKMEPLGSEGDIMLADFSQYAVGLRREMRLESSIHVRFTTDEISHRMITRVDGSPLWNESLTLEDGSTTVGPFVTLAVRE